MEKLSDVSDALPTSGRTADAEGDANAHGDDDDDDHEEDEEDDDEQVSLGFAIEADPTDLLRNHFVSKMGGVPAWLDPVQLPLASSELRCAASGAPLRFLLRDLRRHRVQHGRPSRAQRAAAAR